MHAHLTSFEVKLRFWEAQLANSQLEQFPPLAACVPDDVQPDTCVSVVTSPREEFASRFAGVKPLHGCGLQAVYHPFDFPVDNAPAPMPMELVELSYSAIMNWRRSFTTLLNCPSSATLPSLQGIFQTTLGMFNASYPCLATPTVANSSSPKWSTRSLAFAPSSRTAISKTFFCCRAHPSSRTLKYFFIASSTSRRTDFPGLQYTYCNIVIYIPHFWVFVCHSGPRAAPESWIWPSVWKDCPPMHFMVSTTYLFDWVEQMSFITDHCWCVFPLCSLPPCLLLYWMLLWQMVKLCVYFLFKAPKQFSPDPLWYGYIFSPAIDSSPPDDLRGVRLAIIFWFVWDFFAMFRFHVTFLIWWIISMSSLPRNISFDPGYRLSNRTDSRKNRATALFGLNIENLAKLASDLPYSIWQ